MNLVQTAPTWLLVVLGLLLLAAAVEDAIRLRISNVTCAGVVVAALIAVGYAGFAMALYQNLVVFAAMLAVGTLLFGAGHMGGGDVKLLAALGLWVNFLGAVWLLAIVFIAGGILALFALASRPVRRKVSKGNFRGSQIPYGVAIAAGAAFVFASQLGMWGPHYEKPNPFGVRPLG
jgi:prepilin peptidase CpaA